MLKLHKKRTEVGVQIWTVLIERREKDERQRKRRGDVLEELLCIATAGYCR